MDDALEDQEGTESSGGTRLCELETKFMSVCRRLQDQSPPSFRSNNRSSYGALLTSE